MESTGRERTKKKTRLKAFTTAKAKAKKTSKHSPKDLSGKPRRSLPVFEISDPGDELLLGSKGKSKRPNSQASHRTTGSLPYIDYIFIHYDARCRRAIPKGTANSQE